MTRSHTQTPPGSGKLQWGLIPGPPLVYSYSSYGAPRPLSEEVTDDVLGYQCQEPLHLCGP